MARNYPKRVPVAFLLHSISLHGLAEISSTVEEVEMIADTMYPEGTSMDDAMKAMKMYSTNPGGFPPQNHKLYEYFLESATKMP